MRLQLSGRVLGASLCFALLLASAPPAFAAEDEEAATILIGQGEPDHSVCDLPPRWGTGWVCYDLPPHAWFPAIDHLSYSGISTDPTKPPLEYTVDYQENLVVIFAQPGEFLVTYGFHWTYGRT